MNTSLDFAGVLAGMIDGQGRDDQALQAGVALLKQVPKSMMLEADVKCPQDESLDAYEAWQSAIDKMQRYLEDSNTFTL
eukprot:134864-Pyramimonas_sp.AAC.1